MSIDDKNKSAEPDNASRQGIDKDPAEEKGKQEQVTDFDLKAKKVDADPEEEGKKGDEVESK
jgi:hypothetical protein